MIGKWTNWSGKILRSKQFTLLNASDCCIGLDSARLGRVSSNSWPSLYTCCAPYLPPMLGRFNGLQRQHLVIKHRERGHLQMLKRLDCSRRTLILNVVDVVALGASTNQRNIVKEDPQYGRTSSGARFHSDSHCPSVHLQWSFSLTKHRQHFYLTKLGHPFPRITALGRSSQPHHNCLPFFKFFISFHVQ